MPIDKDQNPEAFQELEDFDEKPNKNEPRLSLIPHDQSPESKGVVMGRIINEKINVTSVEEAFEPNISQKTNKLDNNIIRQKDLIINKQHQKSAVQ